MQNLIFILLLALAVGCTSRQTPAPEPQLPPGLEGKVWQLTTFAVDPEPRQVPANLAITIKFENGKLEGHGGCNGYGGQYTFEGNRLRVSGIIHTKMYCEGASEWENRFFQQLEFAKGFAIRGEIMEIDCGDMGNLVFRLNWKKRKAD